MENDTTIQEVPGTDWKPVNEKTIEDALQMFRKYKDAKDDLTKRITNAEEWWKNNHWERFTSPSSNPVIIARSPIHTQFRHSICYGRSPVLCKYGWVRNPCYSPSL